MRRISIFLSMLVASLGLLIVLFGVSLYVATTSPASGSSWTQQMWGGMGMGGMMGGDYGGYVSPAPSYLWMIPAGLIGVVAVGILGVAFYVAFPEIRPASETLEEIRKEQTPANPGNAFLASTSKSSSLQSPLESVTKTLTPEERKVLDVLAAHGGRYLQKYIRKEAGLSRLKTHRILARFAARGMVTLNASGNTNEVVLSDWLQQPETQSSK